MAISDTGISAGKELAELGKIPGQTNAAGRAPSSQVFTAQVRWVPFIYSRKEKARRSGRALFGLQLS